MTEKLDALKFGYASAIISATWMLLLGILGNIGIYMGAVEMMMRWHMFFTLSIGGIIAGMIECAVWGFIFVYAFAWVYNRLL